MTREELRKKRKEIAEKNGYAGYDTKKFSQNQQNVPNEQNTANEIKMAAQNILRQNQQNVSTWDKVKAKMIQTGNDISNIGKNFGLGVTSASKNAMYYIENMSENKFGEYKRYNQTQSALTEKRKQNEKITKSTEKNNLADMKLPTNPNKRNIKQLSEEEKEQVLMPKKPESLMLKNIDESITKDEEKIQKNVESTSNKVLRKVAELTPSIAQSVTGMAASVVNPAVRIRILADICWRWIYKRSREKWIYWKRCNAIWNYNG